MPALTRSKPKSSAAGPAGSTSATQRDRPRASTKPAVPSFGDWVRKNAGILKNGPADLSMREGFGR